MDSIIFRPKLFMIDREWEERKKNSISVKLRDLELLIQKRKESVYLWHSDKLPPGVSKSGMAGVRAETSGYRDDQSSGNESSTAEVDFHAELSSDDGG